MIPLRPLLKRTSKFLWTKEADEAFNKLKNSFSNSKFFTHPNRDKDFTAETESSDFAIGCILSQISDDDNLLHPIAFYSRCFTNSEINYSIYDKELLAIAVALDVWRHHLEGAKFPIQTYSDHRNLLYFKSPQKLNSHQTRWSIFLSLFDFKIAFRPGHLSGKPDAFSRRPNYRKNIPFDSKTLLKQKHFCLSAIILFLFNFQIGVVNKFCTTMFNRLSKNNSNFSSFSIKNNLFYFKNRIVASTSLRTSIIGEYYDSPGGHHGIENTGQYISSLLVASYERRHY